MKRTARVLGIAIATAAAAAGGCAPDPAAGVTPPPGGVLIVTTDYQTGAYAAIDPETRIAAPSIDVVHQDSICRADPYSGAVAIVSRLNADAIAMVDTAGAWEIGAEFSVGPGANPQDIAFVAADRAYVALYEEAHLAIVDPLSGASLGEVDLAAYADDDGIPEAAWILARGGRVFAALQKLDRASGFAVDGPSSILVLDAETGTPEAEVPLAGANMYGKLRYAPGVGVPLVLVGEFGALDGGVQILDPETLELSPWAVTEAALGGDLSDAVIASPTRGYAVIGSTDLEDPSMRLVAFDPGSGEVGATLLERDGWTIGFVELSPDGGELWVADRSPSRPGVRIFDAASGAELTGDPIDVGLPPFMICFSAAPMSAAPADEVVEAPGDTGEGFGDASHAVDGVHGGGLAAGNADDVFSLGFAPGEDDYVVLSWSGRRVTNGPGPELAVFENAFLIAGGPSAFMDPAIVAVSRDGVAWVEFPHGFLAADPTAYSALPADWTGFAGVAPVLLHDDANPVDPFDAAAAGGDRFDLDDLPAGAEADAIRDEGFALVRISSAATAIDPDTGEPFPHDPISDGPDLDGVWARYLAAR